MDCLQASDHRGCEYCFANNLAWRRLHDSRIAQYKGFYLNASFQTEDGIPNCMYPAGDGDHRDVILTLLDWMEGQEKPLRFWNVTPERLAWMQAELGLPLAVEPERDSWDYIYKSEDLSRLAGRRYHQKRNHLHRFEQYGAVYQPLTEADFDDCITFAAIAYNHKLDGMASGASEQFAIDTYFRHFAALHLQGGVLRVDGKLVAFTIGEPLNTDTFCVHIEKADTNFQGAYAAINQQFAAQIAADYTYINREEDMGLEGLRKAKQSYHPAFMQEKYCVTIHR